MLTFFGRLSRLTRALSLVAVVAILAALVLVLVPREHRKYLTASFPRTVSLYQGSDVRILGVPVGKVVSVTPSGTDVRVRLWYDAKYKVPADAKAVIISPAIVGDRYIELTPVYKGGPTLPQDATLSAQHTAVPLELDQIYQSIDDLTVALGPRGANKQGALTRLLDSTAKNFGGQGKQFHQTIENLSRLTGTLDHNKGKLFGTAKQVERFVSALARNDATVRRFNDSLASASQVLAGERGDLRTSLRNLGVAMQSVTSFVRHNRHALSANIKGLDAISKILVKQRDALSETLDVAPLALNNLYLTYNPTTGTLDTRANVGENPNQLSADPATFLCALLDQADASKKSCSLVRQALAGLPRTAPFQHRRQHTLQVEHIDKSLGGILGVDGR
ncbi:MAG TPA: MCE family protein [Nocardioidaceae bacterium]|nr:MCE family protein [Nocardioidaceae bacterium]